MNTIDKFRLEQKTVVITGGAGMLGRQHAQAVLEAGGIPVLLDLKQEYVDAAVRELKDLFPCGVAEGYEADITSRQRLEEICECIVKKYGQVDVLINNAANNPKVESKSSNMGSSRFENFSVEMWKDDLAAGLTGALLCTQIFGSSMAKAGKGVILNVSSDLGVIAPDQRIYRKEGLKKEQQTEKPVTYSVIKHGLIGLTKYTATYWAQNGVRCNAVCPGGVYNGQDGEFLDKLTALIPMGRMADKEEYRGTILYLISDASSYMNGSTVIVDGGRTCW